MYLCFLASAAAALENTVMRMYSWDGSHFLRLTGASEDMLKKMLESIGSAYIFSVAYFMVIIGVMSSVVGGAMIRFFGLNEISFMSLCEIMSPFPANV